MPNDAPLIEIHNATVYRGRSRVFENLDLTIGRGEQVAILGPNGAGKTTLLKLVNRELYAVDDDDAWVRILGLETWNVWELRSKIGIVSDDLQSRYTKTTLGLDVVLSGYLSSVGTHGLLANRITGEHRDRARQIMADLGVEKFSGEPLSRMSTGQRRRCLLARALVHDPETLILDEPTAGLDLAASFDYLARVRRLIDAGRSIVLVTHHLNEIPPDIERVVLIREGKVVADGPKSEVLTEENLTATYGTPLNLAVVDGHYFAYPKKGNGGR
jgi:iron complex transport system ATP-binding protein